MLNALRRIVNEVNSAHDLNEALAVIVERVKKSMHADVCSVYLNDLATDEHILMATDGLRPGAVGKVRLSKGTGLVGLVAERAEPVNLENAPEHPGFRFVAVTGEAPYHGFLGVPLIRRGKILGVLVVQQRLQRRYTADEEAFLATLAAQLAGSISLAEVRKNLADLDTDGPHETIYLEGVASARGIGIGEAVVIYPETQLESVPDKRIEDPDQEEQRFRQAVRVETQELKQLGERLGSILAPGDRALFDAYAMLLSSDNLVEGTVARIRKQNWAPGALRETFIEYANIFEEMDDTYLQGRSADIRDLGRRLLKRLQQHKAGHRDYPQRTVLMGEEIGVSDFLEVPRENLVGLVSVHGTGASHVALLARGLSIPAVFGLTNAPLDRLHGREVVVDGHTSRVCIQPGALLREQYEQLLHQEEELSQGLQELQDLPSTTPDGRHFLVYTNSGLLADVTTARERKAQGIGLYRSEMNFFLRDGFPGEDEQVRTYESILAAMAPAPVTLRTLDVGGDKPLPYFPFAEQNPFLGWRGIRFSLDQPDIFKTQLRAMLRADIGHGNLSIMFPMITAVDELRSALALLQSAYQELQEDGLDATFPPVGIMIEVPSAAYLIDNLAPMVDFVSIGSNDLTQYVLAVDRNNDRVAKLYDSLHPSVLWTVRHVIKHAQALGKQVSVCGEMAGDPVGALMLVGMGVDCLSMSIGNMLKIKWVIRSVPFATAQTLVKQALAMQEAREIRHYLNTALQEHGLGVLVG